MKNTFGEQIALTIFGESHGEMIGAVLDGLPAGFAIDLDKLNFEMEKRKAKGALSTKRQEADQVRIVSGFFEGHTTGTPLCLLIENTNTRSQDYAKLKTRLRPGHADWSAFEKYNGWQDYRGGGHFSGRLTAPVVAAGAICRQILESKGVHIGTQILQLGHVNAVSMASLNPAELESLLDKLSALEFPAADDEVSARMQEVIENASAELDSVGGILQTGVTGFPAGVGEPFFDSAESRLSHGLFSIPAIKGVSFGAGFGFASMTGSQANDPIQADDCGNLYTETNNNGGINGGITNGMPILFQTCIKPTPSIYLEQDSADYQTRQNVKLAIKGRHDPAIIHRARAVVDAMTAFCLLDLWMTKEALRPFEAPASGKSDSKPQPSAGDGKETV
ncbi:chorismate synthase [Allobaculum fili]|uniref:chorismate synthase n=3 Tax=Allobaculum TaxID=174708 RepID=UPI001E4E1D0C|nr:chorismate synthase [Allobaculum fili]